MSDHLQAVANALSMLEGLGNVISTASKAREDKALSALETVETLRLKMYVLDEAEETLKSLFVVEGPAYDAIQEARDACKIALEGFAESDDFSIAVKTRVTRELARTELDARKAEQKKLDVAVAAKRLNRAKANAERFNSLVKDGVDIPPKMGRTPKLGKDGEVLKGKFVQGIVREGYNIPLTKLVSVRASNDINKWRDDRSNDEDPYPSIPQKVKMDFFRTALSKALSQNGIDSSTLNDQMLREFVDNIIVDRIRYHAALRAIQDEGVDTSSMNRTELQELVLARAATSGKQAAMGVDAVENAAGKTGGTVEDDDELIAAMTEGKRDAKFEGK